MASNAISMRPLDVHYVHKLYLKLKRGLQSALTMRSQCTHYNHKPFLHRTDGPKMRTLCAGYAPIMRPLWP
jgi:hypothetical protein